MALRAYHELLAVEQGFTQEADELDAYAAKKRGNHEVEREAMFCRIDARNVRKEIERFR